jgi:protoporphyrinogen oxidase
MKRRVAIVGNNIAALVSALSLAEQGCNVTLLNAAPGWGGHFSGLELGSWRFDPGMVLYEFGAFNNDVSADILSYDPGLRNDCGRFAAQVQSYVGKHVPTAVVPVPTMLFRGRVYPDLIIANQVSSLRMMDAGDQRRIESELAEICTTRDKSLHPSGKAKGGKFANADFAAISLANHGRFLHDNIMEPLCRKILGVPTSEILSRYHRAAWLPLYYPETLLSQFGPMPQRLAITQFHYPEEEMAGGLAGALARAAQAHPNVRVLRSTVIGIDDAANPVLRLADGQSALADNIVWALDAATLINAVAPGESMQPQARASIGLCFIAIPADHVKRDFSTLFVIEPESAVYRVTNQDNCATSGASTHRLVAEFSTDRLESRGITGAAAQQQAILHELAELGLIAAPESVAYCEVKSMKSVLMIPNTANRDAFDKQKLWLDSRLPGVRIVGPSAGFFAGSMNDQIIQGLKIGAELGEATA